MNFRLRRALPGVLLLSGCAPQAPDSEIVLEETVTLARTADASADEAFREFPVPADAVYVAVVDERLTDVSVRFVSPVPVSVESHLEGGGFEIATTDAKRGARVKLQLSAPPNTKVPTSVALRVRRFAAKPGDAAIARELAGLRAWSTATDESLRPAGVKPAALAAFDRAIEGFAAAGDAAMSAQARLAKANALHFFRIDMREARAEAQRAAQAFSTLAKPDATGAARARRIEALALMDLAQARSSTDPPPDEARRLAHGILDALAAADSPLAPVERARALGELGYLDVQSAAVDSAMQRFDRARVMFETEGHTQGMREMQAGFGMALVERGRFQDGAKQFDGLLPYIHRVVNPERRVQLLLLAARAQSFSGRTDEAAELQLVALAQARDYDLRTQQASALHGLGHVYQNRGDLQQARAFFEEVLRITREDKESPEYVWALASAGVSAREDGDHARAVALHEEAVSIAPNPVAKVRTLRELGVDHFFAGNHPAAIEKYRESLAVDLGDPKHHAYSDVKRNLAQALLENGDLDATHVAEMRKLLAESLASCLTVGDKQGEIGAHRITAELLARQGKVAEALAEYEETFRLSHTYAAASASAVARAAMHNNLQLAFRGYFDLELRDLAAADAPRPRAATARAERALRRLELARQANFDAARTVPLDAPTAARLDALLAQMADKSLVIAGLMKRAPDAPETAQLDALQSDMANLHAEVDRLRTAAARKAAAAGPVAEGSHAWRALAPGAVQVSYALGKKRAYAWARSRGGVRVAVLSLPPEQLERELTALGNLDRQAAPAEVEARLEQISDVLLPPGLLPAGSGSLEIAAEGRIAGVPFPGLRSPADPARRLVETHAITMVTSLYAVDSAPLPQHARPLQLVALASGHGTLRAAVVDPAPKLQAATKEIEVVAKLFAARDPQARIKLLSGAAGSAGALRGLWSGGADVVHFATHALADLRQPLASLLVLPATDAGGKPTYLTAGQVQEWRGDADLVFLSACESAIGPPKYASGMPGLQRAFLRAGARGVIATLWPIEDMLAQEFSADFYARYTRGSSAVQALGETQRAWLAAKAGADDPENTRRRITALAHAYFAR